MATNARSVWVKVWYRRPFSGGSIGDHTQLSPTPSATTFNFLRTMLSWFASSDHVELLDHAESFADHAEL